MMALTSVVAAVADGGPVRRDRRLRRRGRACSVSGSSSAAINGARRRRHPRARHRRHPRDVVRVGGLRAARPRTRPAAGPRSGCTDLVVGPLGNEWIPKAVVVLLVIVAVIWIPLRALAARPVDLRDRQQPARGVPERRRRRANEDPRLRARRACSRRSPACRSTRQHRHRDPGARPVHAPERRGGRARRRQPRRRSRRRRSGRSSPSSSSSSIQTDMTFLSLDTNLALVAQGADPHRRGHDRQRHRSCGGAAR